MQSNLYLASPQCKQDAFFKEKKRRFFDRFHMYLSFLGTEYMFALNWCLLNKGCPYDRFYRTWSRYWISGIPIAMTIKCVQFWQYVYKSVFCILAYSSQKLSFKLHFYEILRLNTCNSYLYIVLFNLLPTSYPHPGHVILFNPWKLQ